MQFDCFTLSMNQGKFLKEAIDSILNQDADVKYTVYDAGSTDGTRKFLENYRLDEFSKVEVDGDLGPADGLNYGIRNLSGDFFYYLNADDRLLPGVLNYVELYFSNHPECDVLHGSINIIDFSGKKIKVLPSMKFSLKGFALGYSVVYQQATFFRTRVFQNLMFNVNNRISWDGELIVDLASLGKVIHKTNKVLGEFRIYDKSISGSPGYKQLVRKEHARIALKILGHELKPSQKLYGYCVRVLKAILRRIFPRISYIK